MSESKTPRADDIASERIGLPEAFAKLLHRARQLETELAASEQRARMVAYEAEANAKDAEQAHARIAALNARVAELTQCATADAEINAAIEARLARVTEASRLVSTTYDAYRGKGMLPAPTQYENLVRAITALSAALAEQPDDGKVLVPIETLQHWLEYWNGNANLRAMQDALEHITDEIGSVLDAAREGKP